MLIPTKIEGNLATDDRGTVRFVNDFNFKDVKRFYQVENHSKNMIRGWHGHKKEAKYVYVIKGAIILGAVTLNFENAKPSKWILSSDKPSILYIPPNYANGFMGLTDNDIIQFFSTSTLEESLNDDYRFPWNKWNIWDIEYR